MSHSWRVTDGVCIHCKKVLKDSYNEPCLPDPKEPNDYAKI